MGRVGFPLKRLSRNSWLRALVTHLLAFYVRLVQISSSWQVIDRHHPEAFWHRGQPFLVVIWHSRMMLGPHSWPREQPITLLASSHGDGQLAGRFLSHFKMAVVSGSSSRGGGAAARQMIALAAEGRHLAITPDGPRGPRMRIKEGTARIAALSGLPVIPLGLSHSGGWFLDTWDRFFISRPLGRGAVVWGQPIMPPKLKEAADSKSRRQASQDFREQIETALQRVTRHADQLCGQPTPEPADDTTREAAP